MKATATIWNSIAISFAAMCVIAGMLLGGISSQRYFWVSMCTLCFAVLGIASGLWSAFLDTRRWLRITAVVLVGLAVLIASDATRRASRAWRNEEQMRFACGMADSCADIKFQSGDGVRRLFACGHLFDIDELGNSVQLKRQGRIAGGGFVGNDGLMLDSGATCVSTLWNRAVEHERFR